jgi:hypothetical protein
MIIKRPFPPAACVHPVPCPLATHPLAPPPRHRQCPPVRHRPRSQRPSCQPAQAARRRQGLPAAPEEVLFLGEVFPAFLPFKKTCGLHIFRHFRVRQQYPFLF